MAQKKPTVYEFIPKLGQLRDDVLFGDVWEHPDLSKRDRSLITVANAGGALPDRRDAGPYAEGARQRGDGDPTEGADHPRGVLCRLALRGKRWPCRHRGVRTEIASLGPPGRMNR